MIIASSVALLNTIRIIIFCLWAEILRIFRIGEQGLIVLSLAKGLVRVSKRVATDSWGSLFLACTPQVSLLRIYPEERKPKNDPIIFQL